MMGIKRILALGLVGAALPFGNCAAARDGWDAWKFKRELRPEKALTQRYGSLILPPEVLMFSRRDLADIRLVTGAGESVPFVSERAEARREIKKIGGKLIGHQRTPRTNSVWVVDLGSAVRFDEINLDIKQADFSKRADVEGSIDKISWRKLVHGAGIFDAQWDFRVHHTAIKLPEVADCRYLRISIDDQTSTPISVSGVHIEQVRSVGEDAWRREVPLVPSGGTAGISRYRLNLDYGFPLEEIELDADDVAFARRVQLVEHDPALPEIRPKILAAAEVYRLRVAEGGGERLSVPANLYASRNLYLQIENYSGPPLKSVRLFASGTSVRIIFPVPDGRGGSLALYYGNPEAAAPRYDLEQFRADLLRQSPFSVYWAAGQEDNPAYIRKIPMDYLPERAARIDPSKWARRRRISIGNGPGIYAITLTDEDLSWLRPDFADLRIFDDQQYQVPYVLESGVARAEVKLEATTVETVQGISGRGVSRYGISVKTDGEGARRAIPIEQIELEFEQGFFSRKMNLLIEQGSSNEENEALLKDQLRVALKGRKRSVSRRLLWGGLVERVRGESAPICLQLAGQRCHELMLEVIDGDNRPLTLKEARAVVSLPRISFKINPAGRRFDLLLGNPSAKAPVYDVQRLRSEILKYDATLASVGPMSRLSGDSARPGVFRKYGAWPTYLLWFAISITVSILVLLTFRLVPTAADHRKPRSRRRKP